MERRETERQTGIRGARARARAHTHTHIHTHTEVGEAGRQTDGEAD